MKINKVDATILLVILFISVCILPSVYLVKQEYRQYHFDDEPKLSTLNYQMSIGAAYLGFGYYFNLGDSRSCVWTSYHVFKVLGFDFPSPIIIPSTLSVLSGLIFRDVIIWHNQENLIIAYIFHLMPLILIGSIISYLYSKRGNP